jgi:hypothetical protein
MVKGNNSGAAVCEWIIAVSLHWIEVTVVSFWGLYF